MTLKWQPSEHFILQACRVHRFSKMVSWSKSPPAHTGNLLKVLYLLLAHKVVLGTTPFLAIMYQSIQSE